MHRHRSRLTFALSLFVAGRARPDRGRHRREESSGEGRRGKVAVGQLGQDDRQDRDPGQEMPLTMCEAAKHEPPGDLPP